MTASASEFLFMRGLEGCSTAVEELILDDLESQGWDSTDEGRCLRVLCEHGTVLIAATESAVRVSTVNRTREGKWVVVASVDDLGEVDAIGMEGNVQVEIETTVNVLEGLQRSTQEPPLVPRVVVGYRGVVRDFVGVVRLYGLQGQMASKRGSRGDRPGQIVEIGDKNADGKLVGVDVTRLRSAPDLHELSKLSVFAPDVESLYDLTRPFDAITRCVQRLRRGKLIDLAEGSGSNPREQAHWFRDLHKAMESMAVPASTRAAVRWCYTLLEHESIKPRWSPQRRARASWTQILRREALENLGRWLHRCVGYGQRPSRAFFCWMAASAGVTVWSVLGNAVEGGAIEWIKRILQVLLSPLGVLRLGAGGATDLVGEAAFEPVAYLLVGLPFIFFVLSMREFFRSPLNQRSSMP